MKEMLKLGITLMVVTLIASLALALTNHYTAPQIEIQKELAINKSLNKVISADSFEEKNSHFNAYDKEGNLMGRVVKIEAPGYSSTVNALAGVDMGYKLTGVDIVNQQETPGLGANIEMEWFLKQFIGKTKEEVKIKKDGGSIDAITGATISSRALTDGIRGAMEKYPSEGVTSVSPEWNNTEEEVNISEETEVLPEILNETKTIVIKNGTD